MKKIARTTFLLAAITLSQNVTSASLEKAEMLKQHGLIKESKLELINVIFDSKDNATKSKSYYILGNMAFNENDISNALEAWRTLINKYPNSKEASLVKDRISELSEIIGEANEVTINNAVAQSYLRHADFWSSGKDSKFTIDSSWMNGFDAALMWYDKTIAEFPGSHASKVAYQDKMRTLLGWKERGKYGSSYGLKENFDKYISALLETFRAFEKEHPAASTLQAFRYQIAQAYWGQKDWTETRKWLNTIIEISEGKSTFYSDAAKRRLEKIEY
ncbi:MAG: hypothetical protein Alis3KO_26350 [Aliiglaciecola sp.]